MDVIKYIYLNFGKSSLVKVSRGVRCMVSILSDQHLDTPIVQTKILSSFAVDKIRYDKSNFIQRRYN